jgi:nucleoid DNA-binding protein
MAKKAGPPTKSDILNQIAKDTGLSRKAVSSVFDSLHAVIKKSLHGRQDDLQGEARLEEDPRSAAQEPEEHGQLT